MKGYDLIFDEKEFLAEARRAERAAKRAAPTRRERTTANLSRMAEDMGLGPIEQTPRQTVARLAGAIANILDAALRREVQAGGKYTLERGETSTGSELIRLDLDGDKYNITITRARK